MSSEKPIESRTAEARIAALEHKCTHMENRSRARWTFATIALLGGFLVGANKESLAQGYGITLAQLLNRTIALETKTANMSAIIDPVTNKPTVRFEGVNVQIVSGSGDTQGQVNGVGNLIIGYNEPLGPTTHIGSHNLIVGEGHSYSSFGGMVIGQANTISGQFATICGGQSNTASGFGCSILGGQQNKATSFDDTVSGGRLNTASGDFSNVSGGNNNVAAGNLSTVSGGQSRTVNGSSDWRAGELFQNF